MVIADPRDASASKKSGGGDVNPFKVIYQCIYELIISLSRCKGRIEINQSFLWFVLMNLVMPSSTFNGLRTIEIHRLQGQYQVGMARSSGNVK